MTIHTSQWRPVELRSNHSAGLSATPPLNLPTSSQAREQAQVAVAVGVGLVAFGLLVLLLLP